MNVRGRQERGLPETQETSALHLNSPKSIQNTETEAVGPAASTSDRASNQFTIRTLVGGAG